MSAQDTPRGPVLPSRWVLLRDILSFVLGWVVVFLEIRRPEIREAVIVFCGTAVGVPMLGVAVQAVGDAVSGRRGGTGPPPSPSPAGPSPPSPPS